MWEKCTVVTHLREQKGLTKVSDLSCSCAKREVKLSKILSLSSNSSFSILGQITWNVLHTTENLGVVLS